MQEKWYEAAMNAKDYWSFQRAFHHGCSRCTLSTHDKPPVLWRGVPDAGVVLVGEAPGQEEEILNKPFTGPAGKLLDTIMSAIGIDTEKDMLITNCVYCRPTAPRGSGRQNYTPKQEQINRCKPFLNKALEVMDPKIIIACGRTAMCALLEDNTLRVGEYEGRWVTKNGRNIFTMTHPAAILHQTAYPDQQRATKRKVWEYMQYFRDSYKDKMNEED